MEFALRSYQDELIQKARVKLREIRERLKAKGLKRGPRLLIQCPTGGGKTAISAFMVQSAASLGNVPVRFNCHRDFLVDQTAQTYDRLKLDYSFIASGRWYNPYPPIHIGMVQSIRSRLAKVPKPKFVLWDEAHHIGAASWAKIMEEWEDATHIGLTATPCRLDGKGLDAYFDDIVLGPPVAWLIANGYLSDYRAYAPSSPDLAGIHIRGKDYDRDEVDEVMDKRVIIGNMVRDYRQYAFGKLAVYFCASIKHSQHVAGMFNEAGIPAMHLDGDHETWERNQAAANFADRKLMVLTNVDLFGEGYDLAAQAKRDVRIECVGLARPTKSTGLFLQQVGRALRPGDDKAVILDHAGNINEHGLPDDEREWSLQGLKKRDGGSGSTTQQCTGCFAQIPATARKCPHCQAVLKVAAAPGEGRQIEEKDGDLHEIDRVALRKSQKLEEWQAGSIDELIDIAKRRGYSNPEKWAGHMWTSRKQREAAREYSAKQQMDFYNKLAMERFGV